MDRKRDGDRDRGRKLKWSQWCGIVVRLVVRRSMRLVRRPCVTSVSLSLSLSALRVYSAIRPSFFHRVVLAAPTYSFPPALVSCAPSLPRNPRDGEPADIFDSWAKKSFAGIDLSSENERRGRGHDYPRKKPLFLFLIYKVLGTVGHARTFRHVAAICACVCVAAKWLHSRMLLRVLFIGILNECDRY